MCAHGREIGRGAENAVHRPTDNESVAAAYDVLWYNLSVLSGRCKPIPIDRKRCKAIEKGVLYASSYGTDKAHVCVGEDADDGIALVVAGDLGWV